MTMDTGAVLRIILLVIAGISIPGYFIEGNAHAAIWAMQTFGWVCLVHAKETT